MTARQRIIRQTKSPPMLIFICKCWHTLAAVGDSLTYVELSKINLRSEGRLKYRSHILLNYSAYTAPQTIAQQNIYSMFISCMLLFSFFSMRLYLHIFRQKYGFLSLPPFISDFNHQQPGFDFGAKYDFDQEGRFSSLEWEC